MTWQMHEEVKNDKTDHDEADEMHLEIYSEVEVMHT